MVKEIHPPTGNDIVCENWQIEAVYRMIQNNLCAEVAERPSELIVYGGKGKAARDWDSYDTILKVLMVMLIVKQHLKENLIHFTKIIF